MVTVARWGVYSWTRRLQLAAVVVLAASIAWALVGIPLMTDRANRLAAATTGETHRLYELFAVQVVGIGLSGAAFYALLLIGTLRLWRWVFWLLVVMGIGNLVLIPLDVANARASVPPPVWVTAVSIVLAFIWVGLGLALLLAFVRYGTWARKGANKHRPAARLSA